MGTGYTRNDTSNNIADGNVIDAADLDGEFDAIQSAFNASTGHTHDGTTAEGAPIEVTGPAQEYVSTATEFRPKTNNTYDLGSAALQWKDLYVDGTANIDSLVADTADINAGTIDGTTIGGTTPAAVTTSSLVATTADINGGTIDGVTIGGSSAGAITGTTITGSSATISGDLTVDTNTLHVDSANNRVGIGTSSPSTPLDVRGSSGNQLTVAVPDNLGDTSAGIVFRHATSTANHEGGGIRSVRDSNTNDFNLELQTGRDGVATTAMHISGRDATPGFVGIGTTSPAKALHVVGDVRLEGANRSVSKSDSTGAIIITGGATTTSSARSIYYGDTHPTLANYHLTYGDQIIFRSMAGPDRMRIDSSGNVGIGTSSPLESLHVNGPGQSALVTNTGYAANADAPYLIAAATNYTGAGTNWGSYGFQHRLKSDAGGAGRVTIDTYLGERFSLNSSGDIRFGDYASPGVFWDFSTGFLGIGTTSPSKSLHVVGEVRLEGASGLISKSDSTGSMSITAGTNRSSTGAISTMFGSTHPTLANYHLIYGEPIIFRNMAGSDLMRIDNSGNILIGTASTGGSKLRIVGLPTSSAGLSAGDVWNDGGTLKIV